MSSQQQGIRWLIAVCFAYITILSIGCSLFPQPASANPPTKPTPMDVSSYNPKQVLELEMAPGVYYTALIVPPQDPKSPSILELYSWQNNDKVWKEVYSDTLAMTMTYPHLEKTRMIPDRDSLVIYSSVYGNTSMVTLRVLSYWNNYYKVIIAHDSMYSKLIVNDDSVIIETYKGSQTIFSWDGAKVVEATAQQPAPAVSPGDVCFRFNTTADGRIELASDKVTISVGDVLHIIHENPTKPSMRVLGPENEKVLQFQKESLADHQVFKGIAPGTTVLKIIPFNGPSRDVTVEVKER
jgi:hypothetical protein